MVGTAVPVQKAMHALTDRANNPDLAQWPALRYLYCPLGRAQHLLVIDPYLGAVTSEPVSAGRQRQLKPAVIACRGRKLLARGIAGNDRPGQWQRRWWSRQGCRAADSHEHARHRLAVCGLAAAASQDQDAGHHASGNAASVLHVSLDACPPSLVSCHMGIGLPATAAGSPLAGLPEGQLIARVPGRAAFRPGTPVRQARPDGAASC
jgi:hypothetical protein